MSSKLIIIGEIYHPLNNSLRDFISNLGTMLDTLTCAGSTVYLMGDFNTDLFKYPHNHSALDIVQVLVSHSFVHLVSRPMHLSSSCFSLNDNIFTIYLACMWTSDTYVNNTIKYKWPFPDISLHRLKKAWGSVNHTCFDASHIWQYGCTVISTHDWLEYSNHANPNEASNNFNENVINTCLCCMFS